MLLDTCDDHKSTVNLTTAGDWRLATLILRKWPECPLANLAFELWPVGTDEKGTS
jgi:hypothetical protein